MLRSLFSGISGLRAHQQMMDVTGNNIANVNTTGYKSSQTVFQDTLSQMVNAAGAPQNQSGGTNPAQAGLGVRLASINANFSQGAAQTTGKSSDMMIQGDGFFVVKSGGESLFTRAGSFTFDANGSLTTPSGQIVQGWSADSDGMVNTSGTPGNIKLPIGISLKPEITENITLTGNFSNESLIGTKKEIPIKVYDAAGAANTMVVTFEKTAATEWTASLPDGSSQAITFTDGRAVGSPDPDTGADSGKWQIGDFSFDIHDLTQFSGNTEARVSNSDGSGAGVLNSYTVSNTGQIVGVFSNGLKQTLGTVALANFNNVNGLEKIGDSMFRSTVNSGLAQVGSAGTAGLGLITSGALEMSNVDLAQEFTNLVIAQRGFQANSRIITTSDEILQELVNLKR
ncbi:flagellar hook protein FlgE [Actinoplanes sp. NBRC 103695]|uniref:flagellar hook protein FlgE n=1 Tax=Actinoplanes sp. NBRC 103695 TaxID=3032202 RepID=UPI0024A45491|nr:flagellar hook protein FlgE [Actinoplanes sp. NBRC 103695]GLY96879.1 flagellar hook protein FlgE [Actinoplanes sp. NBRC 103695]